MWLSPLWFYALKIPGVLKVPVASEIQSLSPQSSMTILISLGFLSCTAIWKIPVGKKLGHRIHLIFFFLSGIIILRCLITNVWKQFRHLFFFTVYHRTVSSVPKILPWPEKEIPLKDFNESNMMSYVTGLHPQEFTHQWQEQILA